MFNFLKKKISYIEFFDSHVIPEIEILRTSIILLWNNIYKDFPEGSVKLDETDEDLNFAVCALMERILLSCWNITDSASGSMIFERRMYDIGQRDGWIEKNLTRGVFTLKIDFLINRMSRSEIVIPIVKWLTFTKIKGTEAYLEYLKETRLKFGISDMVEWHKTASEEEKEEYWDYVDNNVPEGITTTQQVRDIYNIVALSVEKPFRISAEKIAKAIRKSAFDFTLSMKKDVIFMQENN